MTLDQMADRIAGNASSPGEFLVRKQDALHYLNAARCEGYRAGIEAAANLVERSLGYFEFPDERFCLVAEISALAAPKAPARSPPARRGSP